MAVLLNESLPTVSNSINYTGHGTTVIGEVEDSDDLFYLSPFPFSRHDDINNTGNDDPYKLKIIMYYNGTGYGRMHITVQITDEQFEPTPDNPYYGNDTFPMWAIPVVFGFLTVIGRRLKHTIIHT